MDSQDARHNLRLGSRDSASRKSRSFGSLVFFWPFHLWTALTRHLPGPLRALLRLVGYPAILAVAVLTVMAAVYYVRSRSFDMAKVAEMPQRTIVFDRQGQELGRIHGEKRDVVPLDQIAPHFRAAILAREDDRFYHHGPVDWFGVVRAIFRDVKDREFVQGASTITMQLARNSFPLGGGGKLRELDRKFLEIAVSYRIEANYSKDQILQHYVNRIYWGHSILGIEEASLTYFEKSASDLTLSESAMLAGIVRGPNAFSPFNDAAKAIRERNTTLDRMVISAAISREEADAAKKEPLMVRPVWKRATHESYAMDAVRRDLEVILEKENIALGGLVITTTIDGRIQKKTEDAIDQRLRELERLPGYPHQTRSAWRELPADKRQQPTYIQGSAVVIENHSGAVLAVVGGRDADESRFNRALQAKRQVGSIFKPFVYLAAFDEGLRPDTSISDGPIEPGEIKGAPANWHPKNSDGKFGGSFPASYGLIRSRNTMSLRVGNVAGVEKMKSVAVMAGFDNTIPEQPASYLGTWEATPWQVASAYSIFPNGGLRFRPFLIQEIRDRKGNILYQTPPLSYQAARTGSAWSISNILAEVTTRGTAAAVKKLGFEKPCAGKTGTTNDFKDAWFAGYTSALTCAVWVGLDTPEKTIPGGYGATLALPIWVEVMKTAERLGYKASDMRTDVASSGARLCKQSGKRATSGCEAAGTAYTDRVPNDLLPAANDLCPIHPARALPVDDSDNSPPPRATAVPDDMPSSRDTSSARPPRALPVAPAGQAPPRPPRAVPVEDPSHSPRALPVGE
jgi:penicillin-binding protein 1A